MLSVSSEMIDDELGHLLRGKLLKGRCKITVYVPLCVYILDSVCMYVCIYVYMYVCACPRMCPSPSPP